MKPVLILGSTGQVGSALLRVYQQLRHPTVALDLEQIDLAKPDQIDLKLNSYFSNEKPSAVINAAAYTQVDQAEKEEELAHRINAEAPQAIARWCLENQIPWVHYSTDYVFSGEGVTPWKEDDSVGPLSAYGRTKLAGERLALGVGGDGLIFRTCWVYDATGKNFLRTMLRLGSERESLRVVSDQIGAPTFARHLAEATVAALKNAQLLPEFPRGIYHLCNGGETHWCEFAQGIFKAAEQDGLPLRVKEVVGIASSEYPTPAKRPLNSRLNTSKAKQVLGVSLPHWKVGLEECVSEYMRDLA